MAWWITFTVVLTLLLVLLGGFGPAGVVVGTSQFPLSLLWRSATLEGSAVLLTPLMTTL